MDRTVSATEARIRFGELMRRAVEKQEAIIVERGGEALRRCALRGRVQPAESDPISPRMAGCANEIREARARVQAQLGGAPLPPPEEIIREMREERGAQLTAGE